MKKSDIVEKISSRSGTTKGHQASTVYEVFEHIAESLKQGEPIEIRGFGTFSVGANGISFEPSDELNARVKR